MCAECHSTGVRKNYDAANDRFATTFAEISVGCEACHGQGSRHVGWARDQEELVAVRQDRRSGEGSHRSVRRAEQCHLAARAEDRQRHAQHCARSRCARRSRPAGCATPAAASSPRIGCRVDGCRKRMPFRRSVAGSIMPTGRCSTRSTTTVHSSRARCSRPASPAAIAMNRMAPSFERRVMVSACNAMRPTSMRPSRTTGTRE